MNREHILAILYDLSLTIGGEVKVAPLLQRVLQRLLFHTSFPAGLVLLREAAMPGVAPWRVACAVGDHALARQQGERVALPLCLELGGAELLTEITLPRDLQGSRAYTHVLKLPIDDLGTLLLLSPGAPSSNLPITQIFQPVLRNLAKAIALCRSSEQGEAALQDDRDRAQLALDEALRRSERERVFLRKLTDTIPDLIWFKDTEGVYVACNPPFARLYGAPESEIVGRRDEDFVDAELARFFRANDQAAIDAGGARVNEEWLDFPDGYRGLFETTKTPMRDADGRLLGVLGVAHDVTRRKATEDEIAAHVKRLEGTMRGTLQAVAKMVELRDPYTSGHEQRVGTVAADIAREMGWSPERCQDMQLIGLVHDIGKIAVPAEILSKPRRLTPLEYALVKEHAVMGYDILKDLEFPLPIADIILQHHERMDGSGYPKGLKGPDIHPEARVLAVADVLESMSSHRPYRPSLGVEVALQEIEAHRGTKYDADVVEAASRLVREKYYQL